jgi:putative multiple sugar transport system permease protein
VQGYFIAYMKIPSFIVTLAGMLVFKGLLLWLLGGRSVGPFPTAFQALSAGFIPTHRAADAWSRRPNATARPCRHRHRATSTTLLIGVIIVALMIWSALKAGANRESHGYEAEPFGFFVIKNAGAGRHHPVPDVQVRILQAACRTC